MLPLKFSIARLLKKLSLSCFGGKKDKKTVFIWIGPKQERPKKIKINIFRNAEYQ